MCGDNPCAYRIPNKCTLETVCLQLLSSLFRGQGTQVEVVYISEESAMPPLFMRVPVTPIVVAVLAAIPNRSLSNLVLEIGLNVGNTCIDAVVT